MLRSLLLCALCVPEAFGSWQRAPMRRATSRPPARLQMGLFDSLAKAFVNEEFKEDDQRVRASHILIKGEDDVDTVCKLMGEIGERVDAGAGLAQVFAEVARRESQCSSSAMGGDLGLFGPGKMVPEFDDVLFPSDASTAPPPGAIVGPVITDFGCHVILVTSTRPLTLALRVQPSQPLPLVECTARYPSPLSDSCAQVTVRH